MANRQSSRKGKVLEEIQGYCPEKRGQPDIKEAYRGKKLSILLVNKCIKDFESNYKYAFDFNKKVTL